MKDFLSQRITCPHCGNHIHLDIDASMGDQDYVEECTACCNPIHLNMHIDHAHKKLELHIDSDDEQIFSLGGVSNFLPC
ncbi:CPXCG motif-containing cysteine-rich protein [Pseudoalteromonas sp. Hal099]